MSARYNDVHLIGVISDTHGLVRPQAVEALRGSDLIIHAGDIGSPQVLQTLSTLAPLVAIRGNNDREPWAARLPETDVIDVNGARIYVLHDVHDLTIDPVASGVQIVIAGHSHKPSIEQRGSVLFLNPGSAGPRRFSLPIALAQLHAQDQSFAAEIIELET